LIFCVYATKKITIADNMDYFLGILSNNTFMVAFAAHLGNSAEIIHKLEIIHCDFEGPVRNFKGRGFKPRPKLLAEASPGAAYEGSTRAQAALLDGRLLHNYASKSKIKWADMGDKLWASRDLLMTSALRAPWFSFMAEHEQFVHFGLTVDFADDAIVQCKADAAFINSALFIYGLARRELPPAMSSALMMTTISQLLEEGRLYLHLGYLCAGVFAGAGAEDIAKAFIPEPLRPEFVRIYNSAANGAVKAVAAAEAEVLAVSLDLIETVFRARQNATKNHYRRLDLDDSQEYIRRAFAPNYKKVTTKYDSILVPWRRREDSIRIPYEFMEDWVLLPGLKRILSFLIFERAQYGQVNMSINIKQLYEFNDVAADLQKEFDPYLASILPEYYSPKNIFDKKPFVYYMPKLSVVNCDLIAAMKTLRADAKMYVKTVRGSGSGRYRRFLIDIEAWAEAATMTDLLI
jgi:hypothetical protein